MNIGPVDLEGARVRLEALTPRHLDAYLEAVMEDPELLRLFAEPKRTREEHMAYFKVALELQERGTKFTFATIDRASGKFAGSTSFLSIVREHRRLEIGSTWIAPGFQRTHINTEAKLLMFTHSFESLGCIRVELKTDVLNERSRRAILRLGCKEEGILRNHWICPDGRIRNTVYFSVTQEEWPAVKARLKSALAGQRISG